MNTALITHLGKNKEINFETVEKFVSENCEKSNDYLTRLNSAINEDVNRISALGFKDVEVKKEFSLRSNLDIFISIRIFFDKGRKCREIMKLYTGEIKISDFDKNYNYSVSKVFEMSWANGTDTPKKTVDKIDTFSALVSSKIKDIEMEQEMENLQDENKNLKNKIANLKWENLQDENKNLKNKVANLKWEVERLNERLSDEDED